MKKIETAALMAFFSRNAQLSKVFAVSGLIIALALWTTIGALSTIRKAKAETATAIASRETAARFARQFLPASSSETDEWARTTADAGGFGTSIDARLSLAGTASRVAETSGLRDVIVRFVGVDSAGAVPPRSLGDLTFQPASFGLWMEGSGSVVGVARTVLRLPPATEITAVTLTGETETLKAAFQLAVYLSAGGSQD